MSTGMFPTPTRESGRAHERMVTRNLARVVGQFTGNPNTQVGNPARMMLIQTKAVPPVEKYDAWLHGMLSGDSRAKPKVTGAKLRRAVIMIRGGSTLNDVRKAVGSKLNDWVRALPPELAA